jgi:hypothetical protein
MATTVGTANGCAETIGPASTSMTRVIEQVQVLVVAGIVTGVVIAGLGSRVAMLVLRVTSPDSVRGVVSDDGFTIGTVTLSGTYNLLHLGAAFGIIGAAAYRLVAPWLIGPLWFRRLTTSAASGVVVGSMLVHADGVDFTLLKPTWLAISLFVTLPALFGVAIGVAVDRFARPGWWNATSRRRWVVPIVLIACFPGSLVVTGFVIVGVAVCVLAAPLGPIAHVRSSMIYGLTMRVLWLTIALAGLVAIINDTQAIATGLPRFGPLPLQQF